MLEKAKWITNKINSSNVFIFKKVFNIKKAEQKTVIKICGLGFYDFFVNGKKPDEYYYRPVFSDYMPRNYPGFESKLTNNYYAYFDEFDISKFLKVGNNELLIRVANGYFEEDDRTDIKFWSFGKKRLKFNIDIDYGDEKEEINSDESCMSAVSNIRSTLFGGDRVDFSQTQMVFENTIKLSDDVALRKSTLMGDIIHNKYLPSIIKDENNKIIYDFGINHSGAVHILLKGKTGTKVEIRFAEILNDDGTLNTSTSSYPFEYEKGKFIDIEQKNEYILSGNIDEITPLFSWRTFRYAEVKCDSKVDIQFIESCDIYSDIPNSGEFSCSNNLFNEIYTKYLNTQRANMHAGIITDCPHREKMPYTGDGQKVMKSVLYTFDSQTFYSKWLDDIIGSQEISGNIPNTAPNMKCGGGYFWGYAVCVVPINLYKLTGNKEYLTRAYNSVKKWVEYLGSHHTGDYILTKSDSAWFLSDWLAPNSIDIDINYFSTMCYYLSIKDLIFIEKQITNRQNKELEELLQNVKDAINSTFFNKDNFTYSKDVQGETVLALYAGIVEEKYKDRVLEGVKKHYTKIGCFDTGIIMTPILLDFLTQNGMENIAFNIMTRKEYPSYAFMIKDETTLPEHWSKKWVAYKENENDDKVVEGGKDVSHCHPMFGSVCSWLYEYVAGISFSNCYNNIIEFAPRFIDKIEFAKAKFTLLGKEAKIEYNSQNGLVIKLFIPKGYKGHLNLKNINGKFKFVGNNTFEVASTNLLDVNLDDGEWQITKI